MMHYIWENNPVLIKGEHDCWSEAYYKKHYCSFQGKRHIVVSKAAAKMIYAHDGTGTWKHLDADASTTGNLTLVPMPDKGWFALHSSLEHAKHEPTQYLEVPVWFNA